MRSFFILYYIVLFCLCYSGLSAQDLKQSGSKPFVLGAITEIESIVLAEKRTLNIYFPEGYNSSDTIRYPVIYLLDGSADEDFIHIAGLVQYSNFPWVNILKPSIVVGIANVDRRRDFTYPTSIEKDKKDFPTTGGSEKFISFIERELLPFIEKNYKTNASRTIIGQSLGGLLATEILFKKPSLFNNYIIVSPSLWWDNGSLLPKKSVTPELDSAHKISVYIAVGKEGKVMIEGARHLAAIIKGMQKPLVKVSFEYFEKEDHATIFHQAVYNGFKALNTK